MQCFLIFMICVVIALAMSTSSEIESDGFLDDETVLSSKSSSESTIEFNERKLYNEVSAALHCRKWVAKGPKFPISGQIVGNNFSPFICLQVKAKPSKKRGINVIFLVSNSSSETFVSVTTLGLLGYKPKTKNSVLTPIYGTVHGVKIKLNILPREGPTSHINVLGSDFFLEGDLTLTIDDHSSAVVIDKRIPDFVYGSARFDL